MLNLPDGQAIMAARYFPLPATLLAILDSIADNTELLDLTVVLVIEAGETEAEIVKEIGWSPLIHPIDETRYGDTDFRPYWASLSDRGGWYELIHPVGNDGFAYVLLIEDAGDGELQFMCREFAR